VAIERYRVQLRTVAKVCIEARARTEQRLLVRLQRELDRFEIVRQLVQRKAIRERGPFMDGAMGSRDTGLKAEVQWARHGALQSLRVGGGELGRLERHCLRPSPPP
jgi:hypothetical protein